MDYLGQHVELLEEGPGWVAVWWHQMGLIEVGYFPTPNAAWDAVSELIRRDLAVKSLMEVIEDWRDYELISEWEYALGIDSLVKFVLAQAP